VHVSLVEVWVSGKGVCVVHPLVNGVAEEPVLVLRHRELEATLNGHRKKTSGPVIPDKVKKGVCNFFQDFLERGGLGDLNDFQHLQF